MESNNLITQRWLVLIPHRDALRELTLYRKKLWQAGIKGAYSLPSVAFIAEIEKPLPYNYLRGLAQVLRNKTLKKKGYIFSTTQKIVPFSASCTLFGLELDLVCTDLMSSLRSLSAPILPITLLPGTGSFSESLSEPLVEQKNLLEVIVPDLRFRAAALANMVLQPVDCGLREYSYRWSIGKLFWLPNPKKLVEYTI
jgi:hypothetical protein